MCRAAPDLWRSSPVHANFSQMSLRPEELSCPEGRRAVVPVAMVIGTDCKTLRKKLIFLALWPDGPHHACAISIGHVRKKLRCGRI